MLRFILFNIQYEYFSYCPIHSMWILNLPDITVFVFYDFSMKFLWFPHKKLSGMCHTLVPLC